MLQNFPLMVHLQLFDKPTQPQKQMDPNADTCTYICIESWTLIKVPAYFPESQSTSTAETKNYKHISKDVHFQPTVFYPIIIV